MSQYRGDQSAYNQQMSSQAQSISKIFCEDHPNELLTNFCCILDCLKPLCPDCIDYHNKFHKQNHTYPEVDSLKNVKVNCGKKVKAAILALTQELERLELKYVMNPQDIIDEGLENLKRTREKVLQLVNAFFDNMEVSYKKKLNEVLFKGQDFNAVFEKVRNLINELEFLQANLDGSNTINVIKKICVLDLKSLLDKYKNEIQGLIEAKQHQNIDLIINDARLAHIEAELVKLVSIINHAELANGGQLNSTVNNNSNNIAINSSDHLNQSHHSHQSEVRLNSSNYNPHGNANPHAQGSLKNSSAAPFRPAQSTVPQQFHASSHSNYIQQSQPLLREEEKAKKGMATNFSAGDMLHIAQPDFFEPKTLNKYLHFFPNDDKLLYLLDLTEALRGRNVTWNIVNLEIPFKIPYFHKSIISTQGDIYLTGGSLADNTGKKSNHCYLYDYAKRTLKPIASMLSPRSSHSICYLSNYVYVVGGFLNGQVFTGKCEKYSINNDSWKQIANLNHNAVAASLTPFNNKYIFKFGGLIDGLTLNNFIERYDTVLDKWTIIDAKFDTSEPLRINLKNFRLLSTAASCQINAKEIFVFGGYREDNESSGMSFVLRSENEDDGDETDYEIRKINYKPLPFAEGFWNNTPLIFSKCLFALQNIPNEKNDDCVESNRRVLLFDSNEWRSLN